MELRLAMSGISLLKLLFPMELAERIVQVLGDKEEPIVTEDGQPKLDRILLVWQRTVRFGVPPGIRKRIELNLAVVQVVHFE